MSERLELHICADPRDGNDSSEVAVLLPFLPRTGDTLLVTVPSGTTALEVENVVYETYTDMTQVWVRTDGYSLLELDEALASLRTGYAFANTRATPDDVHGALRWNET